MHDTCHIVIHSQISIFSYFDNITAKQHHSTPACNEQIIGFISADEDLCNLVLERRAVN